MFFIGLTDCELADVPVAVVPVGGAPAALPLVLAFGGIGFPAVLDTGSLGSMVDFFLPGIWAQAPRLRIKSERIIFMKSLF